VLQERELTPVGAHASLKVDVRVIAATHRDLPQEIRAGRFREDLWYRLQVLSIKVPPLRERLGDILAIAEHFLREQAGDAPKHISPAAARRLLQHGWPGNVRELRNLMERLAYLSPDDKIDAEDLSFILSPGADASPLFELDLPLADATKKFQTEYIKKHIERSRGNMTDAAARLGLHRSNLYRKMRQLDMPVVEE
jgi:DNA-binding NtrC family response regulator